MNVIYKTIVGSKMHGLQTPTSDEDIRFITMSTVRDILSPFRNENVKVAKSNEDSESWELRHFVNHLTQGNPTIYEVIKSPLYDSTRYSENIRSLMPLAFDARNILKAHIGYASSQISRLQKAFHDCQAYARNDGEERNVDGTLHLLGIPKYENMKYGGYTSLSINGVWEENHLKRIPKSIVAAYRVLAQGRQLLESGDFQPVIKDYSPELHDKLMTIKLMDANTISWKFIAKHIDDIEYEIKELNSFFDSLNESRKNMKSDINAIVDKLCEIYGVQ